MKSHMLQNNINEVRLPQLGRALGKLQWKKVLMKVVTVFVESTNISVEFFLLRDTTSNSSENKLIAEE